jgi:hypothetical protein
MQALFEIYILKVDLVPKSELIYLVLRDKENGSVAPDAYWFRFYARSIISRYS